MFNNINNDFDIDLFKNKFVEIYGQSIYPIQICRGPARINIIGEHIDYNGGFVFPCAIDKYLYIGMRKRDDKKIIYNDLKFPGTFSFDVNDEFMYKKENDYSNYLNGILSIIKRKGFDFDFGFDVLIYSEIPSAGGISSSSALECCFAFSVSELFNFNISQKDIALIGQQSEHEFMNVKCGIMDQYIISTAKENTCELLDCENVSHEYIPLNLGDYQFVVMNTKKKRQLADSKYNERREQCESVLSILNKQDFVLKNSKVSNTNELKNLCSISISDFDSVKFLIKDDVLCRRAFHCVSENNRVLNSVDALKNGDLILLGKLMIESHKSLKENYEVTGIELDTLVDCAIAQNSCLGARMTGAGFGGCAIAIVKKDLIDSFIKIVQEEYLKVIGYSAEFFSCNTSDGVSRLC